MNTFNIQLVKSQPPNPPVAPSCRPVPKLTIGVQSIVCMNYPIEILVQVLSAHFEEDPCAANLVVKALKVISISLKDKELKSQIQNILTQNLHKRDKIYTLMVYWTSFSTNLLLVLSKLDGKLVDSIIACVFSAYCFTKCSKNSQISKFLSSALTDLPSEDSSKISQFIKNQFLSMQCPLQAFLSCAHKFANKDQKLQIILDDISTSTLKSKQTQPQFRTLLRQYFSNSVLRQQLDTFLQTYPNCIPSFISNLQQVLQPSSIFSVWLACRQGQYHRMEFAIKAAIKMWVNVNTNKLQYWNILNNNYYNIMTQKNYQGLIGLLELGYEIQDDTTVPNFVAIFYLYQYLSNHNNNLIETAKIDGLVITKIAQNKQSYKKIHDAGEVILDMHKSYSNIIKADNIQVLTINKIYAPKNWAKSDLMKAKNHQILVPYVQKLTQIEEKTNAKNREKGLIIDLVFHGIVIQVTEASNINNKIELIVTLEQLIAILETHKLPQNIKINTIQVQLPPTVPVSNDKIQAKKQLPSIVIQAKIVRTMKRAKNKLKLEQIYQQVSQQYLHIDKPMFIVALEKVVDRGFVAKVDGQEGNETYEYCP